MLNLMCLYFYKLPKFLGNISEQMGSSWFLSVLPLGGKGSSLDSATTLAETLNPAAVTSL